MIQIRTMLAVLIIAGLAKLAKVDPLLTYEGQTTGIKDGYSFGNDIHDAGR